MFELITFAANATEEGIVLGGGGAGAGAGAGAATAAGAGGIMAILTSVLPFILLIAVFYFLILRPQKKREKAEKNMRESVKVGDSVTTIGGITGKITKIKDDAFIIESGMGNEKSKLMMKKWSIQSVDKVSSKNEEVLPVIDDDNEETEE